MPKKSSSSTATDKCISSGVPLRSSLDQNPGAIVRDALWSIRALTLIPPKSDRSQSFPGRIAQRLPLQSSLPSQCELFRASLQLRSGMSREEERTKAAAAVGGGIQSKFRRRSEVRKYEATATIPGPQPKMGCTTETGAWAGAKRQPQ
eukprot:2852100-Rhodomonas_salina.1